MVKILTAIYIFCSLYAQNPDISEHDFTEKMNDTIIWQIIIPAEDDELLPVQDGKNDLPPAKDDNSDNKPSETHEPELDYIEEMKKTVFYKEDSKDKDLNLRNAILRFQSNHNLIVNGTWDEKASKVLKRSIKDSSLNYPDTITKAPADSKWMTINKTTRILTLYEGKKVLIKYPVAIGNPPSLTPSGKFKIQNKVVNPAWGGGGYAKPVVGGSPKNPLGYRWMGLSYKGGSRYGIHGNNSPYSIGKNISHGCIRMINSDVEELFKSVTVSMHIWIGTKSELEKWGVFQNEYVE